MNICGNFEVCISDASKAPNSKLFRLCDVVRSGKIPENLYSSYEQQCKRMAEDILEGSTMLIIVIAGQSHSD